MIGIVSIFHQLMLLLRYVPVHILNLIKIAVSKFSKEGSYHNVNYIVFSFVAF